MPQLDKVLRRSLLRLHGLWTAVLGYVRRVWAHARPAWVYAGLHPYALLCAMLAVTALILVCWVATANCPAPSTFRARSMGSEAWLLDRRGVPLQRLRLNYDYRMLDWVSLNDISPRMQQAILLAEDKRFYSHPGVDPLAMLSAMRDNLHQSRARGASTITMQLAKLMLMQRAGMHLAHSDWRFKLAQIRLALALDWHWQKSQILEAYLNRVTFRGELVGIDAAARGLLAKGPSALNRVDAAMLSVLVRAPSASASRIARRACHILRQMPNIQDKTDASNACEQAQLWSALLPRHPYPMTGRDDAPHLARRLLTRAGQRQISTLDAGLQRFARQTLQTHLAQLAQQHVEDGAVLVLDNASGEVLAYVGSSGSLSGAADVDGVSALRQPGSTLKPFLYALAMDQGWLQPYSVLDDSPLSLKTPSRLYIPQDYDRDFHGAVSVRTALASSLNVPAVRALTLGGVDRFLHTLQQLGMQNLQQDADFYGYGLALGGAETSLWQLTNAYRTLANQGRWQPARLIPALQSDHAVRQVFTAQSSFVTGDILADPLARSTTFGLSSALSTRVWAAVKTGTSKGMRDNWAIGYTGRYTVGVWVGNFSGEPMWDVSGVTGAAPVWHDIVEFLHAAQPSLAPLPPSGVVRRTVSFFPAIEATRADWQLTTDATQPAQGALIQVVKPVYQLIAPADAAVLAPDPDIPEHKQALLVQASMPAHACIYLDTQRINACQKAQVILALPSPGVHSLILRDTQGTVLDEHQFEVRAVTSPVRPH